MKMSHFSNSNIYSNKHSVDILQLDRWPSWLWRQVKVSLAQSPGHESGVGSSPTLFIILHFYSMNILLRCEFFCMLDVWRCGTKAWKIWLGCRTLLE